MWKTGDNALQDTTGLLLYKVIILRAREVANFLNTQSNISDIKEWIKAQQETLAKWI